MEELHTASVASLAISALAALLFFGAGGALAWLIERSGATPWVTKLLEAFDEKKEV